jgi:hypothetical protein
MCRFDLDRNVDKDNYFLVEGNIIDLCDIRPGESGSSP